MSLKEQNQTQIEEYYEEVIAPKSDVQDIPSNGDSYIDWNGKVPF